MPTVQTAFSWRTLVTATAVAAGFLLLVAGPVLLATRWTRGRPLARPAFLGRNRPRGERSRSDDALPAWASVSTGVGLAAVLTLLGVGVSFEARSVRLAIGVVLGCLVLAGTTVLATRWAAGRDRDAVGYRVSPWLVAAALGACVVTRAADLSPALVVGVLLVPVGRTDVDTGAVRLGEGIAASARTATWRSVALLVVAAAGWVLHSAVLAADRGTVGGFWSSLVSEFAITVCLGGLGSFVLTMLPLARSAGGALWAASRVRYVAIAVVGTVLATAATSPGPDAGTAGTATVGLAVAAAGCLLVMAVAWVRYRLARPQPRA